MLLVLFLKKETETTVGDRHAKYKQVAMHFLVMRIHIDIAQL